MEIYIVNGDSNGNRTKYNGIEWNVDIKNDMGYLMILVELYWYVTSYAGNGMFNGHIPTIMEYITIFGDKWW